MPRDLWGDLPEPLPCTDPLDLLQEQAEAFNAKCKTLKAAVVETTEGYHALQIYCGDAFVRLVKIKYGAEMYPLNFTAGNRTFSVNSEEEFLKELATALTSETVRCVVGRLLAKAK